jgi:hypothetical protein
MGKVGKRPPVGGSARLKCRRGNEQGGDDTAADQENAHDQSGRGQQAFSALDAARWIGWSVLGGTVDVRHNRYACFEPGETECELRKDHQRDADNYPRVPMLLGQGGTPVRPQGWLSYDPSDCVGDDNHIQAQVKRNQGNSNTNGFGKPAEEHPTKQRQQDQGDDHLMPSEIRLEVWVLDHMRGGVGRRQSHGDQEIGCSETQQHQDKDFALPERHEPLEHGDRPFTVRALCRHASVNRQRAEKR